MARETQHPAEALLDRVVKLHSAPQVALRILDLTRDLDFDVREVVDCLDDDPALSAQMLKLVNSAQAGLSRKISSLHQAVMYLGQRSLRLVAMSFSLVRSLTQGATGKLYGEYWKRALTIASVSARLARRRGDVDPNEAYTAGLLADLGVLVLAQLEGPRYADIFARCSHGPELIAAEEAEFGCGHAELGARLLERWGFPPQLIETTAGHHADDGPPGLAGIVTAADLTADVLWTPGTPRIEEARTRLEREFGVDLDAFIGLIVETKQDVLNGADVFDVRLAGDIDCEAIEDQARRLCADAAFDTALVLDSMEAVWKDHTVE